jgi:hypothetical protein
MTSWIRRALTKKVTRKGLRGKQQVIVVEPNEKLVLVVKFALGITACLTILEIAYIAVLGRWNSEIFASITGLSGTVMGIFIGQKT